MKKDGLPCCTCTFHPLLGDRDMNTHVIICTVNIVTMRWLQLHRAAGKNVNARKRDENNGTPAGPVHQFVRAKQLTTLVMNWSWYTEQLHCATVRVCMHSMAVCPMTVHTMA